MLQTTRRSGEAKVLLLVLGALTLLASCSTSTSPLSELDQRAQSLDRSLICPICPGETIDRSQVQLANQMQVIVREQIRDGRSDQEIQQFFVDRYGERVLASPPKEGLNLTLDGTATRSDGDLYGILTNGINVMPTFKNLLSPSDRWVLVDYIRELQGS